MFTKLTEQLDSFLALGLPFYDCKVMKDGECVYRHSGGFTDSAKTKKPTGNELYNIYSCTKLITCTAALQLYEKGMFDLDDELSKYLPEYANVQVKRDGVIRPPVRPITIRHLFTMTAGLHYTLTSPAILKCREATNGECPTRELIRCLAEDPLSFDPGTKYQYSLCHDVLAALIEVLTGMTFGEYVKKNIFDPLGMKDTTMLLPDERLDEIVNQYTHNAEQGVIERDKRCPYKLGSKYESGGAGCISTVDDYIRFIEALRIGDVILKKETIDMMATPQLTPEQAVTYTNPNYSYGLGQRCPKDDTRSDFGWGGAAGAYYAIDRKNGITVYLGTHQLGLAAYQDIRGEIYVTVRDILCGK